MTALRTRMTDDMVVRWMAKATQEAYLAAVKGLATFYHRSPDQISDEEVQAYLRHLMRERKRAWNTCNIVVHGLRFFYHVTLKRDRTTFSIPGGKQPARLPEILSRDEVQRVIAAGLTRKDRVLLAAAYGTGVRVSELVHLKLTDLDAARGMIRIGAGQGRQRPVHHSVASPPGRVTRLLDHVPPARLALPGAGWPAPHAHLDRREGL